METVSSNVLFETWMEEAAHTKSIQALQNVKAACDELVNAGREITVIAVGEITGKMLGGPTAGTIRSDVSKRFLKYVRARHTEQNPPRNPGNDVHFIRILPRMSQTKSVTALWNIKDACDHLIEKCITVTGVAVAAITSTKPGGPVLKSIWENRNWMEYVHARREDQKKQISSDAISLAQPESGDGGTVSCGDTISFRAPGDSDFKVLLNQNQHEPVVIKTPSQQELTSLLRKIESGYINAFWERCLISESPYHQGLPYGLAASQAGHAIIPSKTVYAQLTGMAPPHVTRADLKRYPFDEWQRALRELKPRSIDDANKLLSENGRIRFSVISLIELAKEQKDFNAFVSVLARMGRKARYGKRLALTSLVAMRDQGWVLLDVRSITQMGRVIRGLHANENDWTPFPEEFLSVRLKGLFQELLGEAYNNPDYREVSLQFFKARQLVMCSNVRGRGDISLPLVEAVLFRGKENKTASGYKTTLPAVLRSRWNKICEQNGPEAMATKQPNNHRSQLLEKCPPDPRLTDWLTFLDEQVGNHWAGNLDPIYRAYGVWLTWLSTLQEIPKPLEVKRSHIRDDRDTSANTFRRFLANSKLEKERNRNLPLKKLSDVFDHLQTEAEELGTKFVNPIRYRLDQFPVPRTQRADVTDRSRLSDLTLSELQQLVIQKNSDGSFQWGPGLRSIACAHITTPEGEKVFCPILPAIVYIMLAYPLRTHQTRWTDSGEMDERRLDFSTGTFMRNSAGEKGRASGVIQPLQGKTVVAADLPFEFQIPVNKVLLRERQRSAYTIPYVTPEIFWTIRQVLEWQEHYGAPASLVKEVHEPVREQKRNQKMAEFYPDICPLFRYPGQKSFYPPTHAQINYFWGKLCRLYDDENAKWVNPKTGKAEPRPGVTKLSRIYAPENSWGSWDYANYDLHSLRVANVSRLLDAGVPLAVVASIAGHRHLAMTLHYYKAEREVLRLKIHEALKKLGDRTSIGAVAKRLTECDDAESWLRSTPAGFTALRKARTTGLMNFSHSGICPGTVCENGLDPEFRSTHGHDVPGSRCPLCKFFIYGPPFLMGLAYEYNCLLYELEKKATRQNELRAQVRLAEKTGDQDAARAARGADNRLDRETSLDLKVLARLYGMISECLKLVNSEAESKGVELVVPDGLNLSAVVEPVSKFTQLHDLIETAQIIPASHLVTSDFALIELKDMVLDFLRLNGVECCLAGIPKNAATKAILQLSRTVAHLVPEEDRRDQLMNGVLRLQDMPGVEDEIRRQIPDNTREIENTTAPRIGSILPPLNV